MLERLRRFVRAWLSIRRQRDDDETAAALGRPERLELSDAEACDLEEFFLAGAEGAELAKVFYLRHPRTGFRFFMGLSEDGRVLAWRDPDYDYEAAELLEAAMRQRGALVTREDGDYWQTAHPMVRRLAEVAVKVQMPERKGAGILA